MNKRMTRLMTGCLASLLSLSVAANAEQPKVELVMNDAHQLRDVQLSNMTLKRSAKVVQQELQELFASLSAERLKAGEKLSIKVVNIDLPGYVDFASRDGRYIRVVRRNDVYRLEYEYQIVDENGQVISQGRKKISGFYEPGGRIQERFMRGHTAYFEKDVRKWFDEISNQ
jgi:hypothetical protein